MAERVAAGAGVVALAVTGVFFGFVFFFVAWCGGAWLGMAVWAGAVVATVEASLAFLAFPPPVTPAMMISAARQPSMVRTLWRRSHDVRAGRP